MAQAPDVLGYLNQPSQFNQGFAALGQGIASVAKAQKLRDAEIAAQKEKEAAIAGQKNAAMKLAAMEQAEDPSVREQLFIEAYQLSPNFVKGFIESHKAAQLGGDTDANLQFGAQETLKDEEGNLFFATSERNPKGGFKSVFAAIDGSDKKPVGKLSVAGSYGQTGQERIMQVWQEAAAREQASQEIKIKTEPKLQAEIANAKIAAESQAKKIVQQSGQSQKLEDADRIYKSLSSADLDLIYGKGEEWYPKFFRSQKGIDLIAQKEQLINMLSMAARGELAGQGPITEGEQGMLNKASSVLSDQNISPALARRAIDDAMRILYKNSGREFTTGAQTTKAKAKPVSGAVNWSDM